MAIVCKILIDLHLRKSTIFDHWKLSRSLDELLLRLG